MDKDQPQQRRFHLPEFAILVGMVIIGVVSFAAFSAIGDFQNHVKWVEHTHQVRFQLEQTGMVASDAQSAVRGYVISGRSEFLGPYEQSIQKLPVLSSNLAGQVLDNPAQSKAVLALNDQTSELMTVLAQTVALRRDTSIPDSAAVFVAAGRGDAAMDAVRHQIATIEDAEATLLKERQAKLVRSSSDIRALLIGGTVLIFLVFGTAFWMLSREIRQRQRADQALTTANTALIRHADQLELANKELESFSYSVSHDLRIPLRAVSGYASMLAEDYEEQLDEEGKRLLNVIRDNSKRMGLLIDDLLAFSKLGRQALTAAPIEMQALVESVVTDIRQRDHADHAEVDIVDLPSG